MSVATPAVLAALDAELARTHAPLRSLAPDRPRAHGVAEILGPRLATASDTLATVFADGVVAFVRALGDAFPDNLLWDFDLPLATWFDGALRSTDPCGYARRHLDLATELQGLFGRTSLLRFRYAHDFLYGFDWAKWVGRDAAARQAVGPFDLPFLEAMRARAHELVAIIERGGDPKYPPLPGGGPRNPFPFSREPAAELSIHHALAASGDIPVPAWLAAATLDWRRPYAALREQTAARLGFGPPPANDTTGAA